MAIHTEAYDLKIWFNNTGFLHILDLAALINNSGKAAATDEKKPEVLNNLFALVFNGNLSSHTS